MSADITQPPVDGRDKESQSPPWAKASMPDPRMYVESELAVAGGLSTMPPFDAYHPAWALPFARRALESLDQWEPTDSQ